MVDFHCFRLKVFGAESEVGMYQVMVLLILYDNHSRFCTDGVILDVMVLKIKFTVCHSLGTLLVCNFCETCLFGLTNVSVSKWRDIHPCYYKSLLYESLLYESLLHRSLSHDMVCLNLFPISCIIKDAFTRVTV